MDTLGDLLGKIIVDTIQPIVIEQQMLKSAFSRMVKEGTVEEVDAAKGYRLKFGEGEDGPYLSGWLPHPETGKTSVPLKKNQRVMAIAPGGDLRQAMIVRSGYSDEHKSPNGDMQANVFEDAGVKITIAGGMLKVEIGGMTATLSGEGLAIDVGGTKFSLTSAGFNQTGGQQIHDGKDVGKTSSHIGVTAGPDTTGPVA